MTELAMSLVEPNLDQALFVIRYWLSVAKAKYLK